MMYVIIKQAETYLEHIEILRENNGVPTERLERLAEQVQKQKSWYQQHIDDLHGSAPQQGKISQRLIALRAHEAENAFAETNPEQYSEQYSVLSSATSMMIHSYHSTIEYLAQQQRQLKVNQSEIQAQLTKAQARHKNEMNVVIVVIILIFIANAVFN